MTNTQTLFALPQSKPDVKLWLDDNRGVYIPKHFAECFTPEARASSVLNVSADDWSVLEAGPDHENYWDTWTDVIDACVVMIDGHPHRLHQDGALWLVPEGMEFNENTDTFEWPLEHPFYVVTGAACWASYLINGDASGLEEREIELCDAWCEANDIVHVIDAPGEGYFTNSYALHTGDTCRGGDVIDYVVECFEPWETKAFLEALAGFGEGLVLEAYYQIENTDRVRLRYHSQTREEWHADYCERRLEFPHA